MSWYQRFWDSLADAHERAQNDPAVWRTSLMKRWMLRAVYLSTGHFFCFLTYFLPVSIGFRAAGHVTCQRFHLSSESFRRRRIRAIGTSVIMLSMLSTGTVSSLTDRVLSLLDPNFSLRVHEFFDGYDTEVFVSGFGKSIQTDNSVEDQSVHTRGAVATWQRLTDQGWEILFWTPLDPYPAQLTQDQTDDISPKTDGRLIAWQKKMDGVWRVHVVNVEGNMEVKEVSLGGNASDVQIDNGVVVWREWVNGQWEIMMYRDGGGTIQLSRSQTSSISPVIVAGSIFWEAVDPVQGDKEIYRYLIAEARLENLTDNDADDDSPTLDGDRVMWYERRSDVSLKVWFDVRLDWKAVQPLPELPQPEPELLQEEEGIEIDVPVIEDELVEESELEDEEVLPEPVEAMQDKEPQEDEPPTL